MNTNENFDALWSGLKDQVKQARAKEVQAVESNDTTLPGRVYVGKGSEYGTSMIQLNIGLGANASAMFKPYELRQIAANCEAAAQEAEEAMAARKAREAGFDPMAHGHLLGDIDAPVSARP